MPASQMTRTGQVDTREGSPGTQAQQWKREISPAHDMAMSRLPSRESYIMSSSTGNSYEQQESARMYPSLSQNSYHISTARSDTAGRSSPDSFVPFAPGQQQAIDLHAAKHSPYADEGVFAHDPAGFHRESFEFDSTSNGLMLDSGYSMYTSPHEENFSPLSVDVAVTENMVYGSGMIQDTPIWSTPIYPESQGSSPTLKQWQLAELDLVSTSSSPLGYCYSPSLESLSPQLQESPDASDMPHYTFEDRVTKKPVGPRQSKFVSDMAARDQSYSGYSNGSDGTMRFVSRSSLDVENTARDHPFYTNVTVQNDGLYHCPWEATDCCKHKPEKLKCNYDKAVDSHLKPYRCKVNACENSQFSSTACLLRHEREAHAMHGHGDKPFLCPYEGCDRGASGNGFPRQWNLYDHMKRVHHYQGSSKSRGSVSPSPSTASNSGKNKRKAEVSDSEKAAKKVATPEVRQEPSLMDHYHDNERKLMDVVKQLHDPRNSQNMHMLWNANNCIKVMALTTRRINAAPAMERSSSQQSG